MKQILVILSFSIFLLSCGSNAESDIVGIGAKSFEYIFKLNKDYTADTTIKSFTAKLSLYSDFPGFTHFTVKLDGTKPGDVYNISIIDADSTKPWGIADIQKFAFNTINAIDTTEITYSDIQSVSIDTFVNNYSGYLIVTNNNNANLGDSTFIIKGKIK
jgi:hypothetical protein